MALKSTVVKCELQVSDMDRHHYATYPLTLAQHPSETDARLMVRIAAFALYADERLQFGKGLSSDDEPDLWAHDLTGEVALWIDLGQPDEARIRRACGRAREVVVVNYGGRGADVWWEKNASALARPRNLRVIDIAHESVEALAALHARSMRLQFMVQDGAAQLMDDTGSVELALRLRRDVAA
ncbi:YaeQ family protein [Coralloluteibacterium thermophilus]|uniref:YaeQ family protein n=1 Tax=Coralloluteibacterium thermophilum TaxID=2707049 RepID=A0ABV9NN81_9GAMM